jgi:hypothetical protein
MKKGTHPDQYAEAIALADQAEIGFGGNFIFGDPSETPETIAETLGFYRKYCADIHCFMSSIQPYPGSALYAPCQDMGLIPDKLAFYKTIDQVPFNMTKIPDAQWIGYLRAIYAFDSLPFCKTVDATRILHRAVRNRMTAGGSWQFWELFAECPHCARPFSFVELTDPANVPKNGLQVITGCPRCFKRVRLNVPVTKDQGLLLPIEPEALSEETQLSVPGGGDESDITEMGDPSKRSSQSLREFLDRMVSLCEQGSHREALQYYERNRGDFMPDPALAEFDRLVETLRQKLAA